MLSSAFRILVELQLLPELKTHIILVKQKFWQVIGIVVFILWGHLKMVLFIRMLLNTNWNLVRVFVCITWNLEIVRFIPSLSWKFVWSLNLPLMFNYGWRSNGHLDLQRQKLRQLFRVSWTISRVRNAFFCSFDMTFYLSSVWGSNYFWCDSVCMCTSRY